MPPAFKAVMPIPYVQLQQMLDGGNPWGVLAYEKGTYLEHLSEGAIQALVERIPDKTSPLSAVLMLRLDGAYSQVPEDDTAFGGTRSPRFGVFMLAISPDPEAVAADTAWVRRLWEALQPFAAGGAGYVNAQVELPNERVRAIYGDKYERLARIKHAYDPDNVFHRNANIIPAP